MLSANGIFLCNAAYAYGVNGPAEADPGGGRGCGRRNQPVCYAAYLYENEKKEEIDAGRSEEGADSVLIEKATAIYAQLR